MLRKLLTAGAFVLLPMVLLASAPCRAADDDSSGSGSLQKSDRLHDPLQGGVTTLDAGATQQILPAGAAGMGRQPLQGHVDDRDWYRPLIHLRKGKLTSDDYRQLEFGVTGFISTKFVFARFPVVTKLFSGCPAESAGLSLGDHIVQANHHVFARTDMQPEFWRYIDGRAGTVVTLTVLRGNQYLTFKIVRMNIEELPSAHLRKEYERLMRKLGAPTDEKSPEF